MSTPLDPRQLDAAWDALLSGAAPTESISEDEKALFGLLQSLDRPEPNDRFVQSLRGALTSRAAELGADGVSAPPPGSRSNARPGRRPFFGGRAGNSRLHMGLAIAALLLLLAIPVMYLAIRHAPESERAVPAARDADAQGPPTSALLDRQVWFSHLFSAEELEAFGIHDWYWMSYVEGTIPPSERPSTLGATPVATPSAASYPRLLSVTSGELEIELTAPAKRFDAEHPDIPEVIGPGTATLSVGETLLYLNDGLAAIWNPTDSNATVLAAGFSSAPDQLELAARWRKASRNLIEAPVAIRTSDGPLEFTIESSTIDPGETYGYTISPQTLAAANFTGGRLNLQGWLDGKAFGAPHLTSVNPYMLNNYGNGYFTLSNDSDRPVSMTLIRVEPPGGGLPGLPPATPFDLPWGFWTPTAPTQTPD